LHGRNLGKAYCSGCRGVNGNSQRLINRRHSA
jgi:hypothetical protein